MVIVLTSHKYRKKNVYKNVIQLKISIEFCKKYNNYYNIAIAKFIQIERKCLMLILNSNKKYTQTCIHKSIIQERFSLFEIEKKNQQQNNLLT